VVLSADSLNSTLIGIYDNSFPPRLLIIVFLLSTDDLLCDDNSVLRGNSKLLLSSYLPL
jgi:hypothetical protein